MENKLLIKTAEGVDVRPRIRSGMTYFFTDEESAKKRANQMRSYVYPLYNNKNEHIGYGVPR
jgi:hypothetical protein